MPINKNAMIRIFRIDKALKNQSRYYNIDDLLNFVNLGLDIKVSRRQLFEDLRFMENEPPFYAPIERTMIDGRKRYRYSDPTYSIFNSFL